MNHAICTQEELEAMRNVDIRTVNPATLRDIRDVKINTALPKAQRIQDYIRQIGKRGRPRKDDRTMLNGMLWIVRSGAQWREMPETYGPWQSVYARFAKWRDDGTLEAIFRALSADADMENLSLDSTCIKVHESANGGGKNGG